MTWRKSLLAVALILGISPIGRAQTASIAGTITDPTGAIVQTARITATNISTGIARWTQTDDSGTYRLTNLEPGLYDVRIEHPSFNPVVYTQIQLSVDQVLTIDAKLTVGGVRQEVHVNSDDVAPIDLSDAQVGNLVDSRQMNDLPLILRDPYQLVLLSPGVVQSNSLFSGFSVNGSRERSNNFMLDGTDNNDPDFGGFPKGLSTLNPETTEEFRVLTNSYLPEFGRNNGAIIDIITKRGSNQFHAGAYWFGRYTALSAKDFFAQDRSEDPFVRNQFGYSVSGPADKKKTFFFANEEFQRFSTTVLKPATVPTQAFKNGQFTYTTMQNGQTLSQFINVSDPMQPTYNSATGLPEDTLIAQIFSLYPNPPANASSDGARALIHYPSHSLVSANSITGRLDHEFSEHESLSVRYTYNQFSDSNYQHEDFLSTPANPSLGGVSTNQHNHNLTGKLTSYAKQTVVNELRLGVNRLQLPLTCLGTSTFDPLTGQLDPVGRGRDYPFPGNIAGFGCTFIGDSSNNTRNAGTYTASDNLSWVLGRHTVKIGAEYHSVYSNSANNYTSRTLTDNLVFSNFGLPAVFINDPVNPQNDLLNGDPTLQNLVWSYYGGVDLQTQAQFFNNAGSRTVSDARGFRQREFAAFGQDSFKIDSNLTFTYGIRYAFFGVPIESQNRMSTLLTSPSGPGPFTFTQLGEGQGRTQLYNNNWKNFEPRVSAAWDPFKTAKTSIRAGYGLYHDRVFGQLVSLLRGDPPFQMLETNVCQGLLAFIFFQNQQALQQCTLSNLPPPSTFQASSTLSSCQVGQPCSPILPFLVDHKLGTPYAQNWNLGIQIEPYPSLLLEANYVGAKGTKLLRLVDGNPPQPALVAALEQFCVPQNPNNAMGCTQDSLQFANLWLGSTEINPQTQLPLLPFSAANNSAFLQANLYKSIVNSTYHALQVNITKRFTRGFAIQGAYTYSHAIDNGADPILPIGNTNNTSFQPYPRNSFNLAAEKGNSEFDVTHRLVTNYSWYLPVGKGRRYLQKGALGRIAEGWSVSGISTISSGLPYDLVTNLDTAHTGVNSRPDYNPSATISPSSDPRTQTGPSASLFSTPAFGSAGNLGRNRFRGPGVNNSDAVLAKQTGIRDRVKLDMRFEVYNVFNRVQFVQPSFLTSDLVFGHSTQEYIRPDGTTGARQVQIGMKLSF
jgi:hypothetical protein